MEISLEKIELVKDRTGVNYKEAKDALIKADGSVVDAIIMIEDEIDLAPKSKAGDQASHIIDRVKQLVKKGNVSRIVVKRNEETILNIPVNLGIVGAVWVFWPTLAATVVALGTKCTIELIKDDGKVVCLSEKAADTFGGVKENCSVIADELKGRGGETFTQVKDKAASAISKAKANVTNDEDDSDDLLDCVADDIDIDIDMDDDDDYDDYDDDYFNFDDYVEPEESHKEAAPAEQLQEADVHASGQDDEAAQSFEDKAADEAAENHDEKDDTLDEIEKAGERFEETINDYKKKKGRFRFFD